MNGCLSQSSFPIVAGAVVVISLVVGLILCVCVNVGWWKRLRQRVQTDDDSGVSAGIGRYDGEVAIGGYLIAVMTSLIQKHKLSPLLADVQRQVELQPLTSCQDPPPYNSIPGKR